MNSRSLQHCFCAADTLQSAFIYAMQRGNSTIAIHLLPFSGKFAPFSFNAQLSQTTMRPVVRSDEPDVAILLDTRYSHKGYDQSKRDCRA